MTERLFAIMGTEAIPMVGRKKLMDRIWGDLTKKTPSNLSVVGPKCIGKTVLLQAVANRARSEDWPYAFVLYWELGFNPPQSDDEFISALCDKISDSLAIDVNRYSEHRGYLKDDKSFAVLKEVLDLLEADGDCFLMIWDGFDKPLSQGFLSGSLFGQLRDLFYGKSHRIVTATRAKQSEIAPDKQVEDSPFWTMFDVNPVRIGPFDSEDCSAAFAIGGFMPKQGGEKELMNWTGGNPVLFLSILNQLHEDNAKEFDNQQVNASALIVSQSLSHFLDNAWNICSSDAKEGFRSIVELDGVERSELTHEAQESLISQAFVVTTGTKLKSSCRLLENHVLGAKAQGGSIKRLFGTPRDYESNIRELLEMRLSQINRPVSVRLHKLVRDSIANLPNDPDDCLNNLTRIEELSLDMIWQVESDSNRMLPSSIISVWTLPPLAQDTTVSKRMDANDWRIPNDRLQQILLLERLTGSRGGFQPLAKCVSKDTYVLLNAIHSFRNRTEHADNQQMHIGVAVSALLLCIELLGCLSRELSTS